MMCGPLTLALMQKSNHVLGDCGITGPGPGLEEPVAMKMGAVRVRVCLDDFEA